MDNIITYWDDGVVLYFYGPSACEWIVPGFWHLHE